MYMCSYDIRYIFVASPVSGITYMYVFILHTLHMYIVHVHVYTCTCIIFTLMLAVRSLQSSHQIRPLNSFALTLCVVEGPEAVPWVSEDCNLKNRFTKSLILCTCSHVAMCMTIYIHVYMFTNWFV